jgi:hypothetical protein
MKDNVCVYVVTQSLLYMNMAYVSISMLRRHNQSIPVKVFFIKDGGELKTTNNQLDYSQVVSQVDPSSVETLSQYFVKELEALNVEVITKSPHQHAPDFVHANRMYIEELDEPNVFFIDSDTFILGDVGLIFDKYKDKDLTTLPAPWIKRVNNYQEISLKHFNCLDPFAGCLLLFRNHKSKIWARSVMPKIDEIVSNQDLLDWMNKENLFLIREEVALLGIIHSNNLNAGYFETIDCCQIDNPDVNSSKVVHTFSQVWQSVYQQIFNTNILPIKI